VVAHRVAPVVGETGTADDGPVVPGEMGSTESLFSWNSVMVNPSGLIVSNCGKMRAWSLTVFSNRRMSLKGAKVGRSLESPFCFEFG